MVHCRRLQAAGVCLSRNAAMKHTPRQELRRGADPACIFSLAFSKEASPSFLAVSSDKKTVHVFSLVGGEHAQRLAGPGDEQGTPPRGGAGSVAGWRSYVQVCYSPASTCCNILCHSRCCRRRSFCQSVRLRSFGCRTRRDGRRSVRVLCVWACLTSRAGFGQHPNTLLVIGSSGTFYVASFDMERSGPCEERHSCRFLELSSDL